jgi:hypothetical protein
MICSPSYYLAKYGNASSPPVIQMCRVVGEPHTCDRTTPTTAVGLPAGIYQLNISQGEKMTTSQRVIKEK